MASINPKSLSNSQLEKLFVDLKKSKDSDEIILTLQSLQRFCTSCKDQAGCISILENGILKFVCQTIENHPDNNVRIHSCALLLTLSFTCGEYKQVNVKETALSLLLNLIKESSEQLSFEVVEAVSVQLHSSSFSSASIPTCVAVMEKIITVLNNPKSSEDVKGRAVDFITDLVDLEMFSNNPSSPDSSTASSSTSPSSSPSSYSSSFSSSSSSQHFLPFTTVLATLAQAVKTVSSVARGRLKRNCEGLLVIIREKFGVTASAGPTTDKEEEDLEFVWSQVNKAGEVAVSNEGKTVKCSASGVIVVLGDKPLTKGVVTISVVLNVITGNVNSALGVIKSLPQSYTTRGLGINTSGQQVLPGWALSVTATTGDQYRGIFSSNNKQAPCSAVFKNGDLVTMVVDVNKGNLTFSVNNTKCAELIGEAQIRGGVYLAASLYNVVDWTIQSAEYRNK